MIMYSIQKNGQKVRQIPSDPFLNTRIMDVLESAITLDYFEFHVNELFVSQTE